MPTVFSYLRFSSKKQEQGDSVRRQRALADEYAARRGWVIDSRTFEDLGVSAWKGDNVQNGALGAFLTGVREGKIPSDCVLLVEALDRISRAEPLDALEVFLGIINSGVTLITINDAQEYSRASVKGDWTKLIISIAKMAEANTASANKSIRVKKAWENKRKGDEKLTAMAPPWLKLSADRRTWDIVKEQADKVVYIFKLANEGLGAPTIARRLNAEGIKALVGSSREAVVNGKKIQDTNTNWSSGTVSHVLSNLAVIGTYVPKKAAGVPIEGYYGAPIVEPKIFWDVQNAKKARRWKGRVHEHVVSNLFTGLCYCAGCGARMKFVSSTKPNYYLHCTNSYSGVKCSSGRFPYRSIRYEGLEREVLLELVLILEQHWAHLEPLDGGAEKAVLEGQLALKNEQYNRLYEMQKAGSRRAAQEVVQLEQEIDALAEVLRKWQAPSDRADQHAALNATIQSLIDMANTDDAEEERTLRLGAKTAVARVLDRLEFVDGVLSKDDREWKTVRLVLKGSDARHETRYVLPPFGVNGTRKRASP